MSLTNSSPSDNNNLLAETALHLLFSFNFSSFNATYRKKKIKIKTTNRNLLFIFLLQKFSPSPNEIPEPLFKNNFSWKKLEFLTSKTNYPNSFLITVIYKYKLTLKIQNYLSYTVKN